MRVFLSFLVFISTLQSFAQSWKPVNGSKDARNHYTAFTNANIYIKAGITLENATLLIKNDKIIELGTSVVIPPNALVHDLDGQFIYPSFIDLHSQYGIEPAKNKAHVNRPQLDSKEESIFYWNETVKPEVKAVDLIKYAEKSAEKYRGMGYGVLLSHQMDGLIRGTSTLLSLSNKADFRILNAEAALHYSFRKGKSRQSYPTSLMGMIALIRQAHFDATWYEQNINSVEYNASLTALNKNKELPKIIDAGSTLSMLRADKLGDEFDFQFILKGNGTEYQRIEDIKATEAAVIVPVNFPKAYDVQDPYEARKLSFSKMKEWELASENLRYLQENQIEFTISSVGIKTKKELFENIALAIDKGLNRELAIKSITEIPAKLIGAEEQVGTIEKGKLANFIITSDTLFTQKCKLYSNWVLGKEYVIEKQKLIDFKGTYSLNINKKEQFDLKLSAKANAWKLTISNKNEDKFVPTTFSNENNRISISFSLNDLLYRLSGTVSDSKSRIWTGKTLINGKWVNWAAIKKNIKEELETNLTDSSKNESVKVDTAQLSAKVLYPNMAFGWDSLPTKPEAVIFRNATVWTNEKDGILKNHDVVIHSGKIQMIGYKINLEVMFPEIKDRVIEIDASGKHLTSGIIDEHSHIAISRGVNEAGQAITAEVSIADVVNSDDINIYRQLSGGTTASQLLHGSANPIGGQSALIKMRWGQSPEKMKIDSAEGFIKFALGENVKQSNWGDHNTIRFPQTRMGVEQVFYDAFTRASEYKAEWLLYNSKKPKEKKNNSPPRVDLELEALAEILDTHRFITCHSYIQSEINMLMHVADSMGFTINTFTHILEGYKVADKLKNHGAAASTFSDWWAYKFEVNDAIPYNGAILHEQGVVTGFNSDDAEMGRRLNQEAAKAVKYGGVSEEEAWKFVTLNPARMLHLDHKMGSIKLGKDADLVLWTDNPLSVYAKVVQTYIDGIAYYDLERDKVWRKRLATERERIINKMLQANKAGKPSQKVKEDKKLLYDCETIEQ